ncbi:hypothetical protein SELMODRAFT_446607 [Selaginella moellendorffii]|uniref:30S ribosomal protein S21, chloroplastic n=1 Tax=Selaginella moellendorffii TaxID=88036 RepID=D8SSY2_SELML|nr:30S ribosomal protein S21, chloroplastic [Selaginella moellendorffii]EFJ12559.1 hypothetical protein SELMODRAFT_446607 [Selaginella moellendorffii]|eukprot:XP_002986350.1 30S ribosomal protein S21, chloroplastic [Selaginella moellendorffii]
MAFVTMTLGLSGASNPPPSIADPGNRAAPSAAGSAPARVAFGAASSSGAAFPSAANANLMWSGKPANAAIIVNANEGPDSIVRRFRREVMSAGIIAECRRRRYHETPQEKRKRKQQALARRRKMSRRASGGGGFQSATSGGGGGGGFKPPVDPFAPKPAKSKEEDDREFWGEDDDELIFQ